jgi:2-methylisocitrate lyase-like PEP mutase family enzyme
MGIARVSVPVASILVTHKACMEFFHALKNSPTGILEGQTQWLTTFENYTHFVGLSEYKELEKKFLPKTMFLKKYGE